MAFSTRTIRILTASVLSVVLIAGAYVLSGPTSILKTANAQSTNDLLKAYAAKDSDNDGLPDWQEALYGTDPNNAHSVSPTLTDAEAVAKGLVTPHTSASVPNTQQDNAPLTPAEVSAEIPGPTPAAGSLTDQFGQEFMQDFEAASPDGSQMTADQQQALETQLLTSYSQKASALLVSKYTSVSIHVSPTTSVLTYAASIEQIFRSDDVTSGSAEPIPLMQAFLQNNDTGAQAQLVVLGSAYVKITKDLLAVPVPPSLAAQHLALVQSFDTLSRATSAVNNYNNDPLAVLGSLSLYVPTCQTIVATFQSIAQVVIANGGDPAAGTPGALIVNFARSSQSQ